MWQVIRWYRAAFPLLVAVMVWTNPCKAFEFQGFGAVTGQFRDNSTEPDPNHGAFQLGQLDFFVSQPLGDRLDLLSELVVEGDETGEFVVDLERFQIGYLFSSLLTIRAGRFHTPLGYWNPTFHHGFHLQTSIERPGFIEFEDDGGLLPVHLIGLWENGYQRFGPFVVEYDTMVGNGSKVTGAAGAAVLSPNSVMDNDARKAAVYRVEIHPSRWPEARVGTSGYFDRVEIFNDAGVLIDEVRQMILGFDLSYSHSPVEVIGEYYYVRNKQRLALPQGKYRNAFLFIQAGFTLLERLTLYARYEQQAVRETEDPYFSALGALDTRKTIGGLRYDITHQSGVKFEGRYIDPKNRDDFQEYAAQWTVVF